MSNLIPEGWQLAPITEFASLKHGHQFRTPDFSETGVRVIKIGQVVGDGKVSLKNCDFVRSDVYEETKGFELKGGEILMSLTGNIGRVGIVPYVPYPLLQNYRVGLFSPTNGKCDKEYLAQILGSELVTQQLIDKSNVTAQANFGKADLEQVIVQMPPLPEQQKIATILSSVDDVIEKTRAQIDKLKDLKTGMMQELLTKGIGHTEFKDSSVGQVPCGWNLYVLDDMACDDKPVLRTGPFGSSLKSKDFQATGVPVINIQNLGIGRLERENLYFISTEKATELQNYTVNYGDLVFSRVADVGRSVVIPEYANGWIMSSNLMRISVDTARINPKYLMHQLVNGPAVVLQLRQMVSDGGRAVVTGPLIKQLRFPVPSLKEQILIVDKIDSVDGFLTRMTEKSVALSQLKKALMQDLLSGKVRVKTEKDAL